MRLNEIDISVYFVADSVMSSVSSIVGADGEEIILAIFNSQR